MFEVFPSVVATVCEACSGKWRLRNGFRWCFGFQGFSFHGFTLTLRGLLLHAILQLRLLLSGLPEVFKLEPLQTIW